MRDAIKKERDADTYEQMVRLYHEHSLQSVFSLFNFQSREGNQNIHRWCNKILEENRERTAHENHIKVLERHVNEKAEQQAR